jgi:signal transduction histidine kinase
MIFQRFYRAGDEMTRTTRGTGLGLYLVQQIIAAHGGSVSVTETGPEGTRFEVTIPGVESREVEA